MSRLLCNKEILHSKLCGSIRVHFWLRLDLYFIYAANVDSIWFMTAN